VGDVILELSQHPFARNLVARAKLPLPLPERLERLDGPSVERPLDNKAVLVAGEGSLAEPLARTLARAGAQPWLTSEALTSSFAGPGEAYGRHPKLVSNPGVDERPKVHGIVFDATGLKSVEDLQQLWQTYSVWGRAIAKSGRSVILGRPPEAAANAEEAAACTALDGFNRSLAKEIGAKGATSNLIYVEDGAESRLGGVLRFLLSKASAFVTAQPQWVSQRARWDGEDPWTQPLAGKVALVTGSARGIGEATARVLASEGAHVICLDRPEEDAKLSLVARDVGGSMLLCDILDPAAPGQIASDLRDRHRGVDIVVHNAGITRDRRLARMDVQRWDSVLGINLGAVLRINKALLDGSVLHDGGRVVSLSSTVGISGNDGQTNYAASKAGLIGMTRALAKELAPRGITVNAIAPGFIETRMTDAVPLLVREVGRRLAALGQGGLPEDVARAIAYLATPGAAGVTGQVLRVCGGALMGA
jgi:3-oxoacyl-[acyl-carrier protein] reductase